MTVEFIFHRAKDPFAPGDSPEPPPFASLTHRNNLNAIISDIVHRHFGNHCKKDDIPSWVRSLISDKDVELVYLMCQHSNTPLNPIAKAYHKLDLNQSLLKALRNRTFVEYPTIDIWEQGDFTGALVEADGTFVEGEEESRPVKRRRLDAVGGRTLIKSLLGGYASDEEDEEEEKNVLDLLGGYGTDGESTESVNLEEDHDPEEENVSNLLGGYGTDGESMKSVDLEEDHDPEEVDDIEEPTLADILEAVGHGSFTEDQDDDEEIDWSDGTDDEAELERALERQKALLNLHA